MQDIRRTESFIASACIAIATFASGCSSDGAPASTESTCNVNAALVARPAARLFLTPTLMARLKARAAANDPAWVQLKRKCDGYAAGSIDLPGATAYPNFPNIGPGYQGEEYLPPIMSLGLCYRIVAGSDVAAEQAYGSAGGRLLDAMSTPVESGGQLPSTDHGYGIRNFGVGMAIGFDWLHPALSATTRSNVITSLNLWIDWYDLAGFIRNQPIGNYFAGYFLTKLATALGTEGDNPKAEAYFADISQMWEGLVKPAFVRSMAGGGWPEGWIYGPRAVRGMVDALWAAKTAKGLDWMRDVPLARDQANYGMYFTWPSLEQVDDLGTVRAGTNPAPSAALASALATALGELGHPSAATARAFAADIIAVSDNRAPWEKFLYWDPALVAKPYQDKELSYLAPGPGHVAMRSSWKSDAAWAAFSSGTYINAPDSGEQMFNQGSLSVVNGGAPVLVNATGWIPRVAGTPGEDFVYDDSWGKKSRALYNTFFVSDPSNPFNPGQSSASPDKAQTHVERYEDWGGFVRARGAQIEQMYRSTLLRAFTRDLVFFRPSTFVVFDRTSVTGSPDQWMAFHTPSAPAEAPSSGKATDKRFDISKDGAITGSVRMLLPRDASVQSVSLPGGVTRLEEHSNLSSDQEWLTVISASSTVPEQVRLSASDGNVSAGNVVGVHVQGPRNQVLLFAADQATNATTDRARYTVTQTGAADHVIIDVAPSATGYSVTATAEGDKVTVDVKPGGSVTTTPGGALCYSVSPTGAVGPCEFSPPRTRTTEDAAPEPQPQLSAGGCKR
ncbi:hypothetical protein LZC95_48510 [Pendulispora brunnea]|uniref:Uncharacterized protein n=1 Tax=Pendulispora brunnea TaxID=2905690 RepID=A0ABZ2K6F9_9BACT